MGTTTLLEIEALLSEAIGDALEFEPDVVSTGTTARITATTLANYDWGSSDYFNRHWVYFTELANAGVQRQVKDYVTATTSTGTSVPYLNLRGSALASATGAALPTLRLHRFNRNNKIRAIKRALGQIYPNIHIPIKDETLITGNLLPDASFEWWTSTTALNFYSTTNATLAQTSTGGLKRNGLYSAKVTVSAANGYMYISSDTYPRLLDLMGRDVSVYCWAYPEVADDAFIEIYYICNDGTTTDTLTSTTECAAGAYTLLKLENQSIPDDLEEIQIRFKVATNAKYVYFDDAMLLGRNMLEYLLPEQFQADATVSQIRMQQSGYSDEIVYDISPKLWSGKEEFSIFTEVVNGTSYQFIRLLNYPSAQRRIRLDGIKKLEVPTTDAGTISLDGAKLELLVCLSAHILYEIEKGTVSLDDRASYERESSYWYAKYKTLLPQMMMMQPSGTIRTGVM